MEPGARRKIVGEIKRFVKSNPALRARGAGCKDVCILAACTLASGRVSFRGKTLSAPSTGRSAGQQEVQNDARRGA